MCFFVTIVGQVDRKGFFDDINFDYLLRLIMDLLMAITHMSIIM